MNVFIISRWAIDSYTKAETGYFSSFTGDAQPNKEAKLFHDINPVNRATLEPEIYSATETQVDKGADLASRAFPVFAGLPRCKLGASLRRIKVLPWQLPHHWSRQFGKRAYRRHGCRLKWPQDR
jgi:hypothetical protein